MQKILIITILTTAGLFGFYEKLKPASLSFPPFESYYKEWTKVDSLELAGLPQSALELVLKIYAKARQDDNSPQIIKAVIHRMKFKMEVNEDALMGNIHDLEMEIPDSKFPVKPMLQSMLAESYWQYYLHNRYKFLDRSAVSGPAGEDISTWDLSTLEKKITLLYEESLQNSDSLKRSPLEIYDPVLIQKLDSRIFRPTLYDFIAHRALEFYEHGERGITKPEIEFSITGNGGFLPASSFINEVFSSADQNELKYKALLLYQDLTRFHLTDRELEPLAALDLSRIKFVYENNASEGKIVWYRDALKSILDRNGKIEFSAQIAYEYALFIKNDYTPTAEEYKRGFKKNAEALKILQAALDKYEGSNWAKNCTRLVREITAPALTGMIQYSGQP